LHDNRKNGDTHNKPQIDNWRVRFKSPEIEEAYRNEYAPKDKKQLITLLVIALFGMIPFVGTDYNLFGNTQPFYNLIILRILIVFISLGVVYGLVKFKNSVATDRIALIWMLSYISAVILINSTRPDNHYYHIIPDAILLVAIYLFLPTRFYLQLGCALCFTAMKLVVLIFLRSSPPEAIYNVLWFTYVFVNLGGGYLSFKHHVARRELYSALIYETEISRKLQETLDEVKTLQGILPICSHCKSIRDDAGAWNRLEEYVSKHSEIKFSHGICPKCAKEHYDMDLLDNDKAY